MLNYNSEISRGGEIGRRGGFKIHCPSGRGGSSPFLGTTKKTVYSNEVFLCVNHFELPLYSTLMETDVPNYKGA